jgi:hypothetical protein
MLCFHEVTSYRYSHIVLSEKVLPLRQNFLKFEACSKSVTQPDLVLL